MSERKMNRGELLKKGGAAGAGAVAAGSLAGPAAAARRRRSATPKRGGRVIWALEQDPAHIAPFGGILTMTRTVQEPIYESLLEWDRQLNLKPALATGWNVRNNRTIDFNLRRGVRFHNGKEMTSADVVYSFQKQLNPPLPGSPSVLGQVPAIAGVSARGRYGARMFLKAPDARIFGYLAWQRYSAIVPDNLYDMINPATQAIGTGPYRLNGNYIPNTQLVYDRNPNYWKRGLPYLDGITYRILTDEQARIAALRAGAIHGATVSVDSAKALRGTRGLTVMKGLTAAFRELQFTIKAGENKPWHDRRVRQAVNYAINRTELINRVYDGEGQYSGHVPPGYGPWPLSQKELREKWEKYDLPKARALMRQAGYANGFDVEMTTFSAPLDFPALAALIQAQLRRINIRVKVVAQDPATFAANNGRGNFEWDLTARGMRGDVDGYTAEFNPSGPLGQTVYNTWFSGYRNQKMWRLVGNGRITLDLQKRLKMYHELNRLLMTELLEVPLISVNKYQVVSSRLRNHYVSFNDFNTGLVRNAWLA